MTKGRVLLVTPRPPRVDGRGDQRRAREVEEALSSDWDVEVISWLPESGHVGLPRRPWQWLRMVRLSLTRPLQVALVQSSAPEGIDALACNFDATIFVMNRAVAVRHLPQCSIVDFVDDLGAIADRRGNSLRGMRRAFWHWEARRIRNYNRMLAELAVMSVSHSESESLRIGPGVQTIPLAPIMEPMPDDGDKVAFVGNLYYPPNHDAAMWICLRLAPYLVARGIDPRRIVICGRRPRSELTDGARNAGIELRPDVASMAGIFREAAVCIAPMGLGAGSQYKIIDAVAAHRATVITPLANDGLGLVDGVSGMVRSRDDDSFGDGVLALLESQDLRQKVASAAYAALRNCMREEVCKRWRDMIALAIAGSRSASGANMKLRGGVVSRDV